MNYYITSTSLKRVQIHIHYLVYESGEEVYDMHEVINSPNTTVTDYAVI